jgi:hypothetical protein
MTSEALNLDALRALFADEPEELALLLEEAVNSSLVLIDTLERSSLERSKETSDAAQELKGLGDTIGAKELAALGEEIKALAREGYWDEIASKAEALRKAHRRLAEAAEAAIL